MKATLTDKIYACLAGGLIGDAMGAPVENWDYHKIQETYGWLQEFSGDGTDDSAIKLILCDAIVTHNGDVTADEFAESFLKMEKQYYNLFYIPVRNMLHKIQDGLSLPVYAGVGNMQSSSSAMCISPMGILNACDPRQAAVETYDVAGLIHAGDTTFCRDAACAMAAAVAEAMKPDATVDSVVDAATRYLHPTSSAVELASIREALDKARELNDYALFRDWIYENRLRSVISDSRETVPMALSLFYLAGGDPVKAIEYGANFGWDADTIGTMVGSLAGAFRGTAGLKPEWIDTLEKNHSQKPLAESLYQAAAAKKERQREVLRQYDLLAE